MKKIRLFLVAILGLVLLAGMSLNEVTAMSVDVGFEAVMPTATTIEVSVTKIDSNLSNDPLDHTWGDTTKTSDSMDITFETTSGVLEAAYDDLGEPTGVYGSRYYYAVEIGAVGGSWNGSITTTWDSGSNNDLALHAIATVELMTYVPNGDPSATDVETVALDQISVIDKDVLPGHWPRIYVGLANGNDGEPSGVTPFTAATPAGIYDGTLTFTYTGTGI